MERLKILLCFAAVLRDVTADIYMHNPRGSNDRLDESGRQRNNANRLFDSQNNDRGGYNVGSVYYYQGSKLQIEWTNQHSCKDANSHCEIIIQYMCSDSLRDGATTTTIPENPVQCDNYDCNKDLQYGMHEDYAYYLTCKQRERNKGLFTADQKLKGDNARYTRQNAGGTRRGYECPEERDYYPYWHPTAWRDIAVLTNDATRCPFYEEESENVKGRWYCRVPYMLQMENMNNHQFAIPNNKEDCEAWQWPKNGEGEVTKAEWLQASDHGIDKPACHETLFSRDNHLGNGPGGYPNSFNWTVPTDIAHENCAMRIRYNVSTEDYEAWETDSSHMVTKGRRNHRRGAKTTHIDLSDKYGFENKEEAKQRGYEFKNNPQLQIFEELDDFNVRLALNTAQYGRTFQDRSHSFAIRPRPADLEGVTIHNVNVRGKRGNIVQVYPAVEYDFVPNTLEVATDEYVHFQWTGSNNNPNNNDGQGRAGSDRSNIVQQGHAAYAEGSGGFYEPLGKHGHWGRSYPAHVSNATFLGLSHSDLMSLALLSNMQFRGEMSELDDAGTYFDLGPRKVTMNGIFHYLCTRNNNFSNRSQKGRLIVSDVPKTKKSIGWNGGRIALDDNKARVDVEQGTFSDLHYMSLEAWTAEQGEAKMREKDRHMPVGDGYASRFISIHPEHTVTENGKSFKVEMEVSMVGGMEDVAIYRSSSESFSTWTKVEAQIDGSAAKFGTEKGGVFVARKHKNTGAIVGTVFGCLAIVLVLVVGTVLYLRKNPSTFSGLTRSLQAKV